MTTSPWSMRALYVPRVVAPGAEELGSSARERPAAGSRGCDLPGADHRRCAPARLGPPNTKGSCIRPRLVRGPRRRRCDCASGRRDVERERCRRTRDVGQSAPSRLGATPRRTGAEAVAGGDAETPMPNWMRTIDGFTPVRAAGAGLALTALNPKNVMLIALAAVEIAVSHTDRAWRGHTAPQLPSSHPGSRRGP
jgi:hypothetical protein